MAGGGGGGAKGGAGAPKVIVRKKRGGGGHGHHGGAWKVAYADFVTAMMALFMVMWLVASTDAKSRKEIANYFRTGILPEGDMSQQGAAQIKPSIMEQAPTPPQKKAPSLEKSASDIASAIKEMAALDPRLADIAANVTVTVTQDGVLIEAVDSSGKEGMLFDVSSAKPKAGLIEFLNRIAPVIAEGGRPVRVIGHTDARGFAGGSKNNWDLSYERADAARRILQANPKAPRIDCVAAYGDTQLRDAKNPYAAENRRLALLVLKEAEQTTTAPTDAAGKKAAPAPAAPAPNPLTAPPPGPDAPDAAPGDRWLIGKDHADDHKEAAPAEAPAHEAAPGEAPHH
jgi:chemotaxis protein MotB